MYKPTSSFKSVASKALQVQALVIDKFGPLTCAIDKWQIYKSLVKARSEYGLNSRNLGVLQCLLAIYPHPNLENGRDIIIFASNKKLCERMGGMPDSTLRRHLRDVVSSGLILRRDSLNGNLYKISSPGSTEAFGFDLTPLLENAPEIQSKAAVTDEEKTELLRLRREILLMRRDLVDLSGQVDSGIAIEASRYLEETARILRRKNNFAVFAAMHERHQAMVQRLKAALLDASDDENEQHYHDSYIKKIEPEIIIERSSEDAQFAQCKEDMPLDVVLKACPDVQAYMPDAAKSWSSFCSAIRNIYSFVGITRQGYEEAISQLGQLSASIVIAAIIQRGAEIRSGGAYLRSLVKIHAGTDDYGSSDKRMSFFAGLGSRLGAACKGGHACCGAACHGHVSSEKIKMARAGDQTFSVQAASNLFPSHNYVSSFEMLLSDPAAAPISRRELCDYLQITSSKLHDVLRDTDLSVAARTYPWRRVCSEVLGLQPLGLRSWHNAAKEQIGSEILKAVTDIELKLREPLVTFDQMSRSLGCLPDTLGKALRQGRLCLPFTVLSFGERTRRYFPLEVCVWRDEGVAINLPVARSVGRRANRLNANDTQIQAPLTPQKAIFGGFDPHNRKQNR